MRSSCAAKMMRETGGSMPWPGDKKYEKVLADWSETGIALAGLWKKAVPKIANEKQKEWAGIFAGWFATWPQIADGVRHLNRRRRFCKIGPVTLDLGATCGKCTKGIGVHCFIGWVDKPAAE